MIYIIPPYYEPNTAATNRLVALLESLSRLVSETVKVCFFLPNLKHDKVVGYDLKNIEYVYFWEQFLFKRRYFNIISWYFCMWRFSRSLIPGDRVIVLGQNEVLPFIYKRKGIKIFHERNEFPELFPVGTKFCKISYERYWEICRHISGMLVISTALKDYFVNHGVAAEKIHPYNMIVDGKRFDGLEKQTTEKYIAYCGTIGDTKDGVNHLLKAFSIVSKAHPDILLYIIGRKPSNLSLYNSYLTSEGINEKVVFTGLVEYDKMPQLLKNAMMLVLDRPDNIQAKYGFPTKLGEYLMTGNPVVVTSVGDIPLFLQDKKSALLAQPENEENFAEQINWVIEHPEEACAIGTNGKAVAQNCFNPDIEAKKILNIINQ